jgi:hypothetical protein
VKQRQNPGPGVPEGDAQDSAEGREENAFGQQLADQGAARSSQGGADGELLFPADRARKQQIRDVGASDQQDQADGCQ